MSERAGRLDDQFQRVFTLGLHLTQVLDNTGPSNQPVYVGWAEPGSLGKEAQAIWRICKYLYDGNNVLASISWAGGNLAYDKVWNDRASLTYT